MTTLNQSQAGAIQLDSATATLVASTELLGFEPTSSQIATAQAFLEVFPTTTAALIALRCALVQLELDNGAETPVADALLDCLAPIAAVEAVIL